MNRDEIIAMAREAGFRTGQINLSTGDPAPFIAPANGTSCMVELERFAALVAAREREACAQVCESEEARALYNFDNDLEANRPFWNGGSQIATSCEASIRARGKP